MSGKVGNFGAETYGYRRDKVKGVRVICEPEADVIERIFQMYTGKQMGLLAIARALNSEGIPSLGAHWNWSNGRKTLWAPMTVRKILREAYYKGEATA
jgi:hypothetical protein